MHSELSDPYFKAIALAIALIVCEVGMNRSLIFVLLNSGKKNFSDKTSENGE